MVQLLSDLALARDRVDMSVAFGEAAPRVERVKNVALITLAALVVILFVALASIKIQVDKVHEGQKQAKAYRAQVLMQQAEILEALRGDKPVASRGTTR